MAQQHRLNLTGFNPETTDLELLVGPAKELRLTVGTPPSQVPRYGTSACPALHQGRPESARRSDPLECEYWGAFFSSECTEESDKSDLRISSEIFSDLKRKFMLSREITRKALRKHPLVDTIA
jgi:hypothetical protein